MSFNPTPLIDWQHEKNWSGSKVARYIGISQTHYSAIVNHVRTPSIKTLEKISSRTGIPVADFVCNESLKEGAVNNGN